MQEWWRNSKPKTVCIYSEIFGRIWYMILDLVMISDPLYRNTTGIIWQYGLQQLNFYIICSENAIFLLWWNIRNVDQTLRKKKLLSQHCIQKQKWEVVWINKYWNRLWLIKIMHFKAMNIQTCYIGFPKYWKMKLYIKFLLCVSVCVWIYICVCVCVCKEM